MVAEQPGKSRSTRAVSHPDCQADRTHVIVALHGAGGAAPFEKCTYIYSGCASHGPLHPLPISIIDEAGRGRATHPHQPVLGVEGSGLCAPLDGLADLVAGGGGEGVCDRPVCPARPSAGLGGDQPTQGIILEGLSLCASSLEILDPIDVSHRVVIIFEALQGGQVGWNASLEGLKPAALLIPSEVFQAGLEQGSVSLGGRAQGMYVHPPRRIVGGFLQVEVVVRAGKDRFESFLGEVGEFQFLPRLAGVPARVLHPSHRSVRLVAVLGQEDITPDRLLLALYLPAAGVSPFGIAQAVFFTAGVHFEGHEVYLVFSILSHSLRIHSC